MADDLPGVPGRVLRADGDGASTGGIGHSRHHRNSPHRLPCLMTEIPTRHAAPSDSDDGHPARRYR